MLWLVIKQLTGKLSYFYFFTEAEKLSLPEKKEPENQICNCGKKTLLVSPIYQNSLINDLLLHCIIKNPYHGNQAY
jgi:hypothetical protein